MRGNVRKRLPIGQVVFMQKQNGRRGSTGLVSKILTSPKLSLKPDYKALKHSAQVQKRWLWYHYSKFCVSSNVNVSKLAPLLPSSNSFRRSSAYTCMKKGKEKQPVTVEFSKMTAHGNACQHFWQNKIKQEVSTTVYVCIWESVSKTQLPNLTRIKPPNTHTQNELNATEMNQGTQLTKEDNLLGARFMRVFASP